MKFEWDAIKASRNYAKHGVAFDEALSAFADSLSITYADPGHSVDEERFLLLGLSAHGQVLVVSHVYRAECVRIISARKATPRERRFYESKASH
jgi:uncharacterized DUF497 family protein